MKNKTIIIFILILFSKLLTSNALGYNLKSNIANHQWYSSMYKNKIPTKNKIKIAILGEEINMPKNMIGNIQTYDPYLKKIISPKEDVFTTDTTKILSIINNLNTNVSIKAELSYLNIKIYDKNKYLTEKILNDSINYASNNSVNIIFLENSFSLQMIDSNNTLCKKVTALKNRNIAIVTLAGDQFEEDNKNFFINKCKDIIKIAPLDNKLSLHTNYSYLDNIDYALPSDDFVVYKGYIDSIIYKVESNYQFAPAFFTYILASELARDYNLNKAIKNINKITFLPENNAFYGRGVISTNKNFIVNKNPVIDNVISDNESSFVITWKPPLVSGIKYYQIDVYNTKNKNIVSTQKILDNSAVRYKFDYKLTKDHYITLSTYIDNKLHTSLPYNDYKIEKYKQMPDPLIEIKTATAEWSDDGIKLSIKTNREDPKTYINIALLDGWTQQLVFQDQSYEYKDYLIRVNPNDDKRFQPHIVLLSLNNNITRIPLYPQYTLNLKFINAGKDKTALVGSTEFSCLYHDDKVGCKGAKVNIINKDTGEIFASTKVLPDLTFSILISELDQKVELFATLEGATHRSNTVLRF